MCSYGQPVLLLHGQPHGPYDIFPSGMSGEEIVQTFLRAEPPFPWDGWWGKSKEARKLAKEFLDVSEETAL
jgi:hypothetical protein